MGAVTQNSMRALSCKSDFSKIQQLNSFWDTFKFQKDSTIFQKNTVSLSNKRCYNLLLSFQNNKPRQPHTFLFIMVRPIAGITVSATEIKVAQIITKTLRKLYFFEKQIKVENFVLIKCWFYFGFVGTVWKILLQKIIKKLMHISRQIVYAEASLWIFWNRLGSLASIDGLSYTSAFHYVNNSRYYS